METKTSKELTSDIQAIDDMIIDLFNKRLKLVQQKQVAEKQENYVLTLEGQEVSQNILNSCDGKLIGAISNIEKLMIDQLDQKNDDFLKDGSDYSPYKDAVFSVASVAKKDDSPEKINATIGSLYNEQGSIVALKTVYDSFNQIPDKSKAAYAEGQLGNKAFRDGIFNWINRNNQIHIPHDVVASAGGTGSLTLCINNLISANETLLIPRVCWGSYKLMAKNNNVNLATYELVDKDNKIDLMDLMLQSLRIIKQQGKLVVVINDPCQNPTGLSYGSNNWKILIEYYKKLTEYGKVIILNDVAYIDYCYEDGYDYTKYYNDMNDDMLAVICFSCSKTFSAYGQRVGAAVILSTNQQTVEHVSNVLSKSCRALWSNVNNGFMQACSDVLNNHKEEFIAEKQQYVDLLKQRSEAFVNAANQCGLTIYPYVEGFFVFVKVEDKQVRTKAHQYLLDHHIYTLNFEGGLRVAICSTLLKDCAVLPSLIKNALEVCKND